MSYTNARSCSMIFSQFCSACPPGAKPGSVHKRFKAPYDNHVVQFRLVGFNVLNHPSWGALPELVAE